MKINKINKWFRNILKASSLTAVMFVFQACYGTAYDDYKEDVFISGKVISKSTQQPIQGIKVSPKSESVFAITDKNGEFGFYSPRYRVTDYFDTLSAVREGYPLLFEDIDSTENGAYADTLLYINVQYQHKVEVNMQLEDAQ
ncbi:MAG: carboxypeptidase-like regulatory domain-containing protein [Bacteroidales bacterium]|nr:carboxypeptidase-like regulatory domain-containing protein [Bacteroidales bacterium]